VGGAGRYVEEAWSVRMDLWLSKKEMDVRNAKYHIPKEEVICFDDLTIPHPRTNTVP